MLKAVDIHKKYGEIEVLKGVSLTMEKGEIVSIVGASGAGKSTLLHILGTLDSFDKGEVYLDGEPVHTLQGNQIARFRNEKIGFIFQFHHLLPEFTALENVCIPAWIKGQKKKNAEKEALRLLDLLKLNRKIHHKPSELSGGEQQRVAVARALINQPAIIFADEPTGNLDSKNAEDLHMLFTELKRDLGQTFLIVTHNRELATMSDRVLTMKDGLML